MEHFKIMHGLGDCLIAGAVLQHLNRPVILETNQLLEPVFRHHPTIKLGRFDGSNGYEFKWPSELEDRSLYRLHTTQRFSAQLGFYIDPTYVLNVYGPDGIPLRNNKKYSIVINQYSAEGSRRCMPPKYLNMIHEIVDGDYGIKFIGQNNEIPSITDIPKMIDALINAKLFIGPISFCYHLASCLHTRSVLFTSYMPPHKYSHFFNSVEISARAACSFTCEEDRTSCHSECQAYNYDDEEVYRILHKEIRSP